MKLSILLTTYNSSRYLEQQLDSLIAQTFFEWNLYIRDDCSTDETLNIINTFCARDSRILSIPSNGTSLGAAKGFMYLLNKVESDYFMFCDHDDVWLTDKIEKTLAKMKSLESSHDGPIVVHTDLFVVNHNLEIVSDSYWRTVGLKPAIITKGDIIQVFNCVTGCTMMINKAAKLVSLPYNERAPMHDWWIAIQTIRRGGIIRQVNESLILYRQHDSNAVGAKEVNTGYYLKKIRNIKNTIQGNLERIRFLKEISGIGIGKYFYYKIYYNFVRKF
ncbi:glycosyltransferase family 2 protein [Sphingobacterium olei]|uniref:Glycosyltransferase family 2 protein n=1 Tax=Sphingobacterium olei TaxID=2571155 RepID=A0A4U0NZ51_9SPHI|nr:glycosyltransferase family 2 protein [Sphingobacterium olei]TJZ60105.1 glycosyltransferase family 2 protein [Sphingobacterium olei]